MGKRMRAHYFQHVPFEGLGNIEQWLIANRFEISDTQLYQTTAFPDCNELDLLVIMGGPMSVNDETEYPWLAIEKQYIRSAIENGISVLGICLGAQLMASAMGAKVYKNPAKEIGWFPVHGITAEYLSTFNFPVSTDVFHWHGETFELPPGAIRIASSDGCVNQAFQMGTSAVGLQFHLETTPDSAKEMIANGREELIPSQYVQTAEEMVAVGAEKYAAIHRLMDDLLSFLTQRVR
jgi:GMP synthase-like glutamine amidotransferase